MENGESESNIRKKIKGALTPQTIIKYSDTPGYTPTVYTDTVFGAVPTSFYTLKAISDDEITKYEDSAIHLKSDKLGSSYYIFRQDLDDYVTAFDTGGYTGSWGPEGKIAMIHEKEIVLNKQDTANLLESVQLLRSILTTIDLQAANAQFSSLLSSSYFAPSATGDTLEQNVHIDAHFDNVTDRNEIVEAFNTLINRASQYANRKR